MTVSELLLRLAGAYPGATSEAMASFRPVFYARLRKHEGKTLEDAYIDVLGTFKPTMRQPFPIPADFEKYLPVGHPKIKDGERALDLKGHRERYTRLMANWRTGQGLRGSNGVPEVFQALDFIARQVAEVQAWRENPEPITLTGKQLKLAQKRAISQQRRVLYGPPASDPDVWWDQITGIARQWGIAADREEWTATESKVKRPAAEPRAARPPFKPDNSLETQHLAKLAAELRAKQDAARQPKP